MQMVSKGRGRRTCRKCLALLCLVTALASRSAAALDLFGLHLFGPTDEAKEAGIVDPVAYSAVVVSDTADAKLLKTLNDASLLADQQDLPPSGLVGLLQRAKDDQANLVAKLYEEGRYGGLVRIAIDGRPYETIGVTEGFRDKGRKVPVTITVTPGPEFTFANIVVVGATRDVGRQAAESAGLMSGVLARSITIVAAENAIVSALQKEGHAYAKITGRTAVADHKTLGLDVTIRVEAGPKTVIDGVEVRGNMDLDHDFIVQQADVPQGAIFHPDVLERARKNLAKLDALASVTVKMADAPDTSGHAPVIIEVAERKRRTIGAGAYYSSVDGAGGEAFWMHRNLFGRSETLRAEAEAGRLLEATSLDEYDGHFALLYAEPGIIGPYSRLDLKGTILQEEPDPYHRRGVVFESLVSFDLTDNLTLSSGITYDWSRIDDAFGRNNYSLLTLPVFLTYDSRNDALDPTGGTFAKLTAEPEYEINHSSLYFMNDAELRYFLSLDDDGRFVLASRGRIGTIWGADIEDIPAHRRFYAGGGGSVRGYEYLNIGPRVEGFGATGGLARVEGSLEARVKVTDSIGIVPFLDAGYVTETAGFGGDHEFQVGAGLGLRYFTAVGPIRLDVAVPLNPHAGDPDFAVYFGIGQAF